MDKPLALALVLVLFLACSDNTTPGGFTDSRPLLDAVAMEAGTDNGPGPDLARLDAPMATPDGPVTVKPDGPVTVKPDGPVTVKPDGPVTVKPDGPVTVKPDLPVTPLPDGPVTPAPDGPVTPAPDGPVTPAPDGPVTPLPDGPVTPAPDGPVIPTPDGPSPPASDGITTLPDGPPLPQLDYSTGKCSKHCDCTQGQACIMGGCLGVGAPLYCCSKSPCPAGSQCVNSSGTWTTCAGGTPGCKSHCQCSQGEACQSGKCVKTTPPTYCCTKTPCPANTICHNANDSAGICMGSGTTCKTHCDCNQGQTCVGGSCFKLGTPAYCCTKAGCPPKKSCYKTDGSKSNCP